MREFVLLEGVLIMLESELLEDEEQEYLLLEDVLPEDVD